jgi:hypothetical protein
MSKLDEARKALAHCEWENKNWPTKDSAAAVERAQKLVTSLTKAPPMKPRKYHIVIARCTIGGKWEMTFGDYDKNVAQDERNDQSDSSDGCDYDKFKVVTLGQDDQATIDAYMAELNSKGE